MAIARKQQETFLSVFVAGPTFASRFMVCDNVNHLIKMSHMLANYIVGKRAKCD